MPVLSRPRPPSGLIVLVACAVLVCMLLPAYAQSPGGNAGVPATVSVRPPTEAEVERAAREHRMPTDAELERVPIPSTPNLDGAGKPAPVDVEAIARRYPSPQGAVAPDANNTSPRLQIFVTLAMPEASLSALIAQAVRVHAVLVLRGAKNGLCHGHETRAGGSGLSREIHSHPPDAGALRRQQGIPWSVTSNRAQLAVQFGKGIVAEAGRRPAR